MYEQFYKVRTNPFALTPDPDYLFLSEDQREAIAGLMYAILARRGFSVLIGDAGTGKTTLLRALMRWIPESRAAFSVMVNPTLNATEFLRTCVAHFGIDAGGDAKDVLLTKLHRYLVEADSKNKVAVLIVDEAQRLSTELLEEVRLLTNFETDKAKLLQVVLAGQDELADLLDRHDLRQLKQRVSTRLHIKPLAAEAIGAYIRHRWSRSSTANVPFDAGAIAAIHEISGGIPRLINSICENALLLGFAQAQQTIDAGIIGAVATDLHLAYTNRPIARVHSQPPVERSQRLDVAAPLPIDSARRTPPMPTLQRDTPRRGWRVLFGRD